MLNLATISTPVTTGSFTPVLDFFMQQGAQVKDYVALALPLFRRVGPYLVDVGMVCGALRLVAQRSVRRMVLGMVYLMLFRTIMTMEFYRFVVSLARAIGGVSSDGSDVLVASVRLATLVMDRAYLVVVGLTCFGALVMIYVSMRRAKGTNPHPAYGTAPDIGPIGPIPIEDGGTGQVLAPEQPRYPQGHLHGKALGRWVGRQIRREMGLPKYTTANRTIAMQRIEGYRKEHLPHLRHAHYSDFLHVAFYHVFQPCQDEIALFDAMHTTERERERRRVLSRRDYFVPFLPTFVSEVLGLYRDHGVDF